MYYEIECFYHGASHVMGKVPLGKEIAEKHTKCKDGDGCIIRVSSSNVPFPKKRKRSCSDLAI